MERSASASAEEWKAGGKLNVQQFPKCEASSHILSYGSALFLFSGADP